MLKCRHLRVRVRAPRVAVMRRREQLALLLPVLPLAADLVHLLVEMKVLQGAKIKRIGRRRMRTRTRGRGTMKRGRRMSSPPPPPENTRKKNSRKKSKRGRRSR
jgi:hypothetical protein